MRLRSLGLTNCDERVKNLKRSLRMLQRQSHFNKCKDESIQLHNLMHNERDKFWKKISKFRKNNSKKLRIGTEQPSKEDFLNFYSTLFSHEDRPSDRSHLEVEGQVKSYSERLIQYLPRPCFRLEDIYKSIERLACGKSPGYDDLTNEFFIYGCTENVALLLLNFFNALFVTGQLPCNFNTSVLVPIPKGENVVSPNDFRPISLSTPLATILESLILQKMDFLMKPVPNQFGYREKTSCKNAVFLVNEVIAQYEQDKSNIHIVSLDAEKAFDKVWREGLFFKLKNHMEPALWRLLFNYYSCSKIVVKYENTKSNPISTTQGIKQGGILSGYLFNFYINDLITSCLSLGIGARIGSTNASCIAYCDDTMLLSPVVSHMNKLIEECFTYADRWKIKFNPAKSVSFSLIRPNNLMFNIRGTDIPVVEDGFVYLGMPIGTLAYTNSHFEHKFAKVERAFYSLRGLGCRAAHLPPLSMAFIYKQYCQSIFRYGLENLFIDAKSLECINIRQNRLIKHALGINARSKTKPLMQCLFLDQIKQLYFKHKVFGIRQFMSNELTRSVFNHLESVYSIKDPPKRSFFKQKKLLEAEICTTVTNIPLNKTRDAIDSLFNCTDQLKINEVNSILKRFKLDNAYQTIKELQQCLKSF